MHSFTICSLSQQINLSTYHMPGAVLTLRTKGIRKGPCLCRTSICVVQWMGGRQNMNKLDLKLYFEKQHGVLG